MRSMPRRGHELEIRAPPKKGKAVGEPPTLDVSFSDDEALPPGIVFTDILQKKWRIGKPIGRGSFGRIYLASDDTEKEVTKLNARYVVKIEPHTNGPLFVEIHCLIRTAQVNEVKAWRQQNKRKRLGMPIYIASGSFTDDNSGDKYRFLVLPRYDVDLQKVISRTKVLDLRNVLVIAIQILDVLEYLHSKGYTHCDIKSSNLMLGFDGNKYSKGAIKPPQSFQKDDKQIVLLSKKHRKAKSTKSRASNYYDDEDYKTRERSSTETQEESDKRLATVKKKLRKILADKDSRTLHRHHAFNLRQLSNYVNYEDLNSSVCSDQSYQNFLDDFGQIYSPRKVYNESNADSCIDKVTNEIHREAVFSQSNGQIYLLDYGLASKFVDSKGRHKPFDMDARKAHDGTLEYSSRDSHIGAHSRRSDLETLGFNLLDWLTGTLPWKTTEVLAEPDLVHVLKKNYMNDTKSLLKSCFKTEFYPHFMEKYLLYVKSLDFTEKPDYDYCRSLFRNELLKNGYVLDKELNVNFAETPMSPMRSKLCYSKRLGRKNTPQDFIARNGIKKAYERENVFSLENDLKLELLKQTLNTSSDGIRKPCASRNFFISDADLVARLKKSLMPHDGMFGKKLSPKNLRSKKNNVAKRKSMRRHRNSIGKFGKFMGSARQFTWAEILAGNPEDIIRKERNPVTDNEVDDDSTCKYRIRKLSNASENSDTQSPLLQNEFLHDKNPTYAMKEVIANLTNRINRKITKEVVENCPQIEGYTPAMMKYYLIKQKREADEKLEAQIKLHCIKQVTVRCTRSMTINKPNKPQTRSTSTKRKIEVDIDQKSPEKAEEVAPRRSKRNTTKEKGGSKDDVAVVESPKNTSKNKKTSRKSTVTVNRRQLRSSRRKKS